MGHVCQDGCIRVCCLQYNELLPLSLRPIFFSELFLKQFYLRFTSPP